MAYHKGKAAVIMLILLLLVSLSLAGGVYYLFQKEHEKNLALQRDLEDIKINLKKTEVQLKDSEKKIGDLSFNLKEAKGQIDLLSQALEQEKKEKLETSARLDSLRTDLDKQKELRTDLESKLNKSQEELRRMQAQLSALESKKTELEQKVSVLETQTQQVELGKVVVSPEPSAGEKKTVGSGVSQKKSKASVPERKTPPLEGKILVINKDYNFAVINLGLKNGLAAGDVFSVYRGGKYIGDVKVEKLHESMAAAGFAPELKDKISESDEVVQKK